MGPAGQEDSPRGPCESGRDGGYWCRPTKAAPLRPMIHDDIRDLLDAPNTGAGAPSLAHLEHTLTSGYARALALEAERLRIERRLADIAARLTKETTQEDASELARLGQRLSVADDDLTRLRTLLVSLRSRADEVRARAA